MNKMGPIGIFDSGVGGLSICHAVRRLLPSEDLVYFADQLYSPYGEKNAEIISSRSEKVCQFLTQQGCKALVIACNTATTNAIAELRSIFQIPIIGVEPAIKVAALTTKSGRIGVLATRQTLASQSFKRLAKTYSEKVNIQAVACPEFIPLVEELAHESQGAYDIVEHYVRPMLANGCDKVVLGCTHFSFLSAALSQAVKDEAELIDTAIPVAVQVQKKLQEHDLVTTSNNDGAIAFWTSSNEDSALRPFRDLWGSELTLRRNALG